MPTDDAAIWDYGSIREGETVEHAYQITGAVYDHFVAAFGDVSPIHVDADYARSRGFDGEVMHGALLTGFISHFVGMRFPGKNTLLQSVSIQYGAPSYLHDELLLAAKVAQKVDALKVVVLSMRIQNLTRNVRAARARVQVGLAA